jgi:cytochrome d ubiquinol oxidase subunit II
MVAYALLGSTWLIMKTSDDLQRRMRNLAQWIAIALLVVIVIVSIWTPIMHPQVATRWLSFPNLFFLAPVPVLVLGVTWLHLRVLRSREVHAAPFVLALLMIFLGYTGLAISMWPFIIPPSITIWAAASPPESMGFALIGTLFIIPIILVYTTWSYYVFRGKQTVGEGYH